jgi:hypothetical protein
MQNRDKVDMTKFQQEKAIYAFTIVTIIFLPLSAVSSIFGMNTADIRNMDQGQWLYWATAVPVTIMVIFLGLLWTGELQNILAWVVRGISGWGYGYLAGKNPERRDLGRSEWFDSDPGSSNFDLTEDFRRRYASHRRSLSRRRAGYVSESFA